MYKKQKPEILSQIKHCRAGDNIKLDTDIIVAESADNCTDCYFNNDECFHTGVWKACALNPRKIQFKKYTPKQWTKEHICGIAVCLSTDTNVGDSQGPRRIAGHCYLMLTDFRKKIVKYVGEDGQSYTTDRKWVFKKIPMKTKVLEELLLKFNQRKTR